jgi:hypothetical protein
MKNQTKIETQEKYEALIQDKANKLFEKFKEIYDVRKNKVLFKNEYKNKLRINYEELESKEEYLGVLIGIRSVEDIANEGQTYFDSIIQYQKNSDIVLQDLLEYLTDYYAIIRAQELVSQYPQVEIAAIRSDEIQDDENSLLDSSTKSTLRQQYLAIKYLIEGHGTNINSIEKTELTRFWFFLSGKNTNSKSISNTREYEIVKKPFPKSDKGLEKDLQKIRDFFEKLGIRDIVEKINKEINSKE